MNSDYLLAYVDMLFAMLLGLFSIFILSFMLINPKVDKGKIDSRVQLQILLTWDDHSPNDIDLWVLCPDGSKIGYNNRENTYMSLDRDDLGQANDYTVVDGVKTPVYVNREVVSIRARHPGRYTVNAYFYALHADLVTSKYKREPEEVKVELDSITPSYKILQATSLTLIQPNDEATAFSFTIEEDGSVDQFSTESKPFITVKDTEEEPQ